MEADKVTIDRTTNQTNSTAAEKARQDPLGRDAFMNLLLTQLQHQDPTQPQADGEFLAQLAQFSALEQLQQMNKKLEAMSAFFISDRVGAGHRADGGKVMGFSASLSGLNVNQQKLNVIGNNLANINTIGYKASTVQFMDLVSQSAGGSSANPMQVGLGVTTGSISPSFKQGGIENTGVPTNVAIQGNGFFVVGDSNNRSYTRAGDFSFDADGMLVTSDGLPVQGFTATDPVTGAIITTGQPGSILVPPGVLRPPTPTSQFGTVTNLNADAVVGLGVHGLGAGLRRARFTARRDHHLHEHRRRRLGLRDHACPARKWPAARPARPRSIATGTITFDGDGMLDLVDGAAAADVVITEPGVGERRDRDRLHVGSRRRQRRRLDHRFRRTVGDLVGHAERRSRPARSTASASTPKARFSRPSAPAAASRWASSRWRTSTTRRACVKLGSNRYGESASAGIPNVGIAGTGGRGSLIGSSLEQSNVDIAQEFTQMILAQRGYQANSKSITVADELLVDTLNLKR